MEYAGVLLGRAVAAALLRDHMDEHGDVRIQHGGKDALERRDVMAVDRSGAHEPELLEQHLVGNDELLDGVFQAAADVQEAARRLPARFQTLLQLVLARGVGAGGAHAAEVVGHGADAA